MDAEDIKHLKSIERHIRHVRESCQLLAERLLEQNKESDMFCLQLISNGNIHDNSKFYGIEWLYLREDKKETQPDLFQHALYQHQNTNRHHPEYWNGIQNMGRLYIAEMVCDWNSRSMEFGTDLMSYIKDVATKRFGFSNKTKIYKEIKYFTEILLDKPFGSK